MSNYKAKIIHPYKELEVNGIDHNLDKRNKFKNQIMNRCILEKLNFIAKKNSITESNQIQV